ncbi:MAG: undecaprenyl-diphosphate phosphatase [Gammaproteobacteria bacterium]|nr:undecaprenyl-diphosphate phosphatase [Gammaproteobacteria bacterium]
MEFHHVTILSLIQGITEFLPISSSAHLILPSLIFDDWPDQGLTFDTAVHLGTLVAILTYYRRDMMLFCSSGKNLLHGDPADENIDFLAKIIVATIPVLIVGAFFQEFIANELRSLYVLAGTTILFGLILWWADQKKGAGTTISYAQALLIGIAQTLALIPGTSRSGVTITVALFLGMSRSFATRFSFMLSIPAISGAFILKIWQIHTENTFVEWTNLMIGTLLSGLSSLLCIHIFVSVIERTGLAPYAIYRIILGIALLSFTYH